MPSLEFVGQSARDGDNIAANPSRLVNFYREPVVPGGTTGYTLKSVLGTTAFADLSGVFVRAMREYLGFIYATCGGFAYKTAPDGTVLTLGPVVDSENATIAGNNGKATFCSGGKYYVWDGASLTEPATGAFSFFGSLDYIGGYTVLTQLNGSLFQWCAQLNPTSLPGLSFSDADGREDKIVRGIASNGVYYILKKTSYEIWYLTGQAGASAFARQSGGVYDVGLRAHNLVTAIDGGLFMVGDDGRVYLVAGIAKPIPNPAVETAIRQNQPLNCFTYDDEGHTFCVITFADRAAWVYDIATGEWAERAEGVTLGPWTAAASARLNREWYLGRNSGAIVRLGRVNSDEGMPLVRSAISQTLRAEGKEFIIYAVEMLMRAGFADASIDMRFSDDGGVTFGPWMARHTTTGQYRRKVIWEDLGAFFDCTAELRISDPVDISVNATCEVTT